MKTARHILERPYFPLLTIILIATFFRFLWLSQVPGGITNDELTYILTAKAVALTGSDLLGKWHTLSAFLFRYPSGTPQAEFPYLLFLPVVSIFPLSLVTVRFLYAFLSVLTVICIYAIAGKLFDRRTAIIAGLVAAFNPWSIYIGRTTYEVVPAVFFFMVSFYLLLRVTKWQIIWVILPLFLAFYSYIGTKVSFLPFTVAILVYVYYVKQKRKYGLQYLLVGFFCLALVSFFFLSLRVNTANTRAADIFSPLSPVLTELVDVIRKVTLPTPLTPFFENKLTLYMRIVIEKVFTIFSFPYLFVHGDLFVSLWRHGLFYYLDVIFIGIGAAVLFGYHRKIGVLFVILGGSAILPEILYSPKVANFTPHIALVFPFLILTIAVGLAAVAKLDKKYILPAYGLVGSLYVFSAVNFFHIYFFQFPLQGHFDAPVRSVARYLSFAAQKGEPVTLHTPHGDEDFKKILFYNHLLNSLTIGDIKKNLENKRYVVRNISLANCEKVAVTKTKNLHIYDVTCGQTVPDENHLAIKRLSDSGEAYRIFNDTYCRQFSLSQFPTNVSLAKLDIEKLSGDTFCETFISR